MALRASTWFLRRIPRPGLVAGGAGHILEIFLAPLRSCPTCLGLYRRTQRPADVEPLHLDMGSAMPIFPNSPQWIAPCASAFSLEKEEANLASCTISHLPAKWEADGTNAPKFFRWKSPTWEGSCPTTTSSFCQWPGQSSVFAGNLFLTGRDQIIERILCNAGPYCLNPLITFCWCGC